VSSEPRTSIASWPGGGLSSDGACWIASAGDFFLPVRALSRVFRGKFLAGSLRPINPL
jgi:Putative transposase